MRSSLAVLAALALAGCAGVSLSQRAIQVPLLDALPLDGEYETIGPVEASLGGNFGTPAGNNDAVRALLRNKAAELGADFVVATDYSPAAILNFASIKGIAYRRKGSRSLAAAQTIEPAPQQAPQQAAPRELAPAPPNRALPDGKLAVLDFKNYVKELMPETVRYFTDLVRSAAVKRGNRWEVMTRENLMVLMQATGKDLAQCEGECEVDTGRRLGADIVVTGDLQKIGSRYKLSLRLHETRNGRLLGAEVASGGDIDALDLAASTAAEKLFGAP